MTAMGRAAVEFFEDEALAQPVRGHDIPQAVREQWAQEVEAEKALESAQSDAERDARAVQSRDDLVTTTNYYSKARAEAELGAEELAETLTKCSLLRTQYEAQWRDLAYYAERGANIEMPERIAPLGVDIAPILNTAGRL